jgi:hypothetical protein
LKGTEAENYINRILLYSIAHGDTPEYAEWRASVKASCEKLGLPVTVASNLGSSRLGSKIDAKLLNQLELVCSNYRKKLRVPSWVIAGGRKTVLAYLAGLIDTDGSVNSDICICQKDPLFIGQLAMLFRSLGCSVTIEPTWNKTYNRYYYKIHVLGESLQKLAKEITLRSEKQEKLQARAAAIKRTTCTRYPTDYDSVRLVLSAETRLVYDVHVNSEDHLYVQGGLVGHNCVNFGIFYGAMAPTIAAEAGISLEEAESLITRWFARFHYVQDWKERVIADARRSGYVESKFGRRRRLPGLLSQDNFVRQEAERQCINAPIQADASDMTLFASVLADEVIENSEFKSNDKCKTIEFMTVHDSLMYYVPEGREREFMGLVKPVLEGMLNMVVPFKFDFAWGKSWGSLVEQKKAG